MKLTLGNGVVFNCSPVSEKSITIDFTDEENLNYIRANVTTKNLQGATAEANSTGFVFYNNQAKMVTGSYADSIAKKVKFTIVDICEESIEELKESFEELRERFEEMENNLDEVIDVVDSILTDGESEDEVEEGDETEELPVYEPQGGEEE